VAHFFEKKDRHVIPNWRSFDNTAKLGELNGSKGIELISNFKPDISDILEDWTEEDNKTIGVAGDILGVALVSNQEQNPKIIEIAKFVLQNEGIAPKALTFAAKGILKPTTDKIINLDFDSIELFQDETSLVILYKKINDLKRKLRENPSNSINWIEIGRLYAIIGQSIKAERAIRNALFLAPENRFILRNMTRFFVHLGEDGVSFAHDIIRKSTLVNNDPWLLSTEISLATLRGRNSKFIKQGQQIIDSNSFHPFNITELASSLATVEMKNSNIKKSRKLFEQSLKKPNDNSLAQAEWASQEETNLFAINSSQMNLANSYEAMARDFAEKGNWVKAIEYSKKWFLDLPFSKGSILFGNNIALKKLRDHNIAAEVGMLGLRSHPHDPHLLNNIIYSLCLQDKTDEAELLFQKVDKTELTSKSTHNVCLLATLGLLNYRKGNPEKARKFYLEAMNLAKEIGKNSLVSAALINMTREEIILGKEDLSDVIPKLMDISKKSDDEDLKEDVKLVLDLYNKKK
jgi:tetratricopeptide (TPR) repeat protein